MKTGKLFKNIHLLSLLGTGSMSVLTFLFSAVLYRFMEIEEIGIWFFFQTTLAFFDMFRQGFLSTAFVKFYAGATFKRQRQLVGSTWIILGGITSSAIVIDLISLLFIHYIKDASLRNFISYFSFNFVASLPMIIAMCLAQAQLRFDRLLSIRLIQISLLIISFVALILLKRNDLQHLMYINIFASVCTSLRCLIKGWTGIHYIKFSTKKAISELFNFGRYTVGTIISANLFNVTNATLINFILGPSHLAIYNLGTRLMEIVEIPLRSFVATAMPMLSKYYNQGLKHEVVRTTQKYIGTITLSIIPALLFALLFADLAMGIIGGSQYYHNPTGHTAGNIFRLFVLFALFYPADRFLAVMLDAIHKPEINFRKILIMLCMNLSVGGIGLYVFQNIYVIVFANTLPVLVAIFLSLKAVNKHYAPFRLQKAYQMGAQEIFRALKKTMKNT
ncbi:MULTISPECIES: lipopolysaccharide biosynthesis protein [Olivibacter]|uniref:Lipopolysaccharide biosynthesis protein n=1 Tax=Olivibacter oleidegradans TaxID=760123 RepID=A0ABV6HN97_9SPHI|nr:oligosaccharide flippase family protein [Olivibacter jilunii]